MSLIHNERIKLLATYLNGLAIAVFAVGALAPIFSSLYGSSSGGQSRTVIAIAMICVVLSAALHFIASLILRRLQT